MKSQWHRPAMLALMVIILSALACNLGGGQVDSQATVQAVYATITVQAAFTPQTPQPTSTQAAFGLTQPPTQLPTQPAITNTPPSSRGSVITIGWCTGAMATDGADTDWNAIPNVTTLTLNTPTFGSSKWSGLPDQSGTVKVCWTQSSLFFFAHVVDDVHAQSQRGADSWKGDEVELMFDADLRGDFFADVWNSDDSQLSFNPGNFADLVPQPFRYRPTGGQPRGVNMVAKATGTSADYVIEAEITWEELLTRPTTVTNYGLCFAFNDNDSTSAAQEDSLVSHCAGLSVPDPTTYQTVTFAPAP